MHFHYKAVVLSAYRWFVLMRNSGVQENSLCITIILEPGASQKKETLQRYMIVQHESRVKRSGHMTRFTIYHTTLEASTQIEQEWKPSLKAFKLMYFKPTLSKRHWTILETFRWEMQWPNHRYSISKGESFYMTFSWISEKHKVRTNSKLRYPESQELKQGRPTIWKTLSGNKFHLWQT